VEGSQDGLSGGRRRGFEPVPRRRPHPLGSAAAEEVELEAAEEGARGEQRVDEGVGDLPEQDARLEVVEPRDVGRQERRAAPPGRRGRAVI